jgi:hypothetical protein
MQAAEIVEAYRKAWQGTVEQAVALGKDATPEDIERVARAYAGAAKTSPTSMQQKIKAVRWLLSDGKTTVEQAAALGQSAVLSKYQNRNRGKFEGRCSVQLHMLSSQREPFKLQLDRIQKAANLQNREHVIDLLIAHLIGVGDDYWKQMAQGRQA